MDKIKFLSPSLLAAVTIQILCQIFKLVYYSLKSGRAQWHRLIHPGGMPSAHSAFVTALSISVGLYNGFNSELFALSFVFSIIIIYDSIRLRGAVQLHSRLLSKLSGLLPEGDRIRVPQNVGHTVAEIAVGIAVGGIWAVTLNLIF